MSAYNTDDGSIQDNGIEMEEPDLNDPRVLGFVPGVVDDGDAEPIERVFKPTDEGPQWVVVKLREDREGKPSVVVKKNKEGGYRIQSNVVVRAYRRDDWGAIVYDEERALLGDFVRDWYPSTMIMKGQKISELNFILKCGGQPFPANMNLQQMMDHVRSVFEQAGDDGIKVPVYVQWLRSQQKMDKNGMPVYDDAGRKVYEDVAKGMKQVASKALADAVKIAREDPAHAEQILEYAKLNPHVFVDHDGETKSVQCQVARIVTAMKADEAEEKRSQASINAQTEAAVGAAH